MGKKRSDRYEYRGILKEESNRHNMIDSEHPQSRRGIEESQAQILEALNSEPINPRGCYLIKDDGTLYNPS